MSSLYLRGLHLLWQPSDQLLVFLLYLTPDVVSCMLQDELEQMLKHPEIAAKRIPVLFFANKVRQHILENILEGALLLAMSMGTQSTVAAVVCLHAVVAVREGASSPCGFQEMRVRKRLAQPQAWNASDACMLRGM